MVITIYVFTHTKKEEIVKEIMQQYNKNVWEERNIFNAFKP